jgi:glycine oxidase
MAGIAVMGAGVLGLCAAFDLARRGARVTVIERDRPGAGASGGLVGALAPHAPDAWTTMKALQLESLLMAEAFWAEVARTGGCDPGYARLGRVQPLADAAAVARAEARTAEARNRWGSAADWRVVPAAEVPGLRIVSPTGLVVHDTLSARIAPRRALAALVAAIGALGVPLRQGAAPPPGAEAVVWATGPAGLTELGRALDAPMGSAVKGQAALLAADWRAAPQLSAPGLHIVPHADGTVAIGSTSERDFAAPDTTDAQLDRVIARARALCPDLADAPVVDRWASLRARAPSRGPILGPWPGRDGHVVLNGGFKTGFGMAPKLAALLADVLEGRAATPPGLGVIDNLGR